jgi:MFS family permease
MKSPSPAFAALRYPEFRGLIGAVFLLTLAQLAQEIALGYELYLRTHDPLTLGFIGLAEVIPFIVLALLGGHLADRREKRNLLLGSLAVMALASVALLWVAHDASLPLSFFLIACYASVALIGFARGFYAPAASALKSFLVQREHFGNAATWSSAGWQGGAVLGPMLGGFLYAAFGLTGTLWVALALVLVAALLIARIQPRGVPPMPEGEVNLWQSMREGIDFVRKTPIIFYSISLDLFSVLFGGVVAILPIYAEDILKAGPQGLGVMRAAPSVGAMLTLLVCAWLPPTGKAWRNLLLAVAGFGIATLVFAVSPWFWLSVFALFCTGAFDSVSVIIRSTILQVFPPDHLRGRVQAVNSVFLSCSNELGAFESGLAAHVLGTVRSVVCGGIVTMSIVSWVALRSNALFAVRLQQAEPQGVH